MSMVSTTPIQPGLVLVTGASGFVGSALVQAFHRAGYPVRALVRRSSPRTNLSHGICEIVEGDLRDRASLALALREVRYLVHAAADYRLWAPSLSEILDTNVEGTRNIMEAALRAGVERVVHTSSVATIAVEKDGTPSDETRPLDPDKAIGAYKRSKVLAERLVEQLIAERNLPAVIVNPSAPIGPRDIKPTPTGRIIVEAARGRMPGFLDTGLNLAHVDDIAAGHLAALQRGRIGARYILGGENVSLRDMLSEIARIVSRKPPRWKVPVSLLFPLASTAEALARRTGKTPFLTRDSLEMARYRMFYSDEQARRELGYRSRPFAEGLVDAITWFRDAGYLR